MDFRRLKNWSRTIGRRGEDYACRLLVAEGFHILLRNYRPASGGELDIIARDGGTLVFIEVKTRFHRKKLPQDVVLSPGKNLKYAQRMRILRGIRSYFRELDGLWIPYRIDLIEVVLKRFGAECILHHKDIRFTGGAEDIWQQKSF